jgi:hypothetical protein
MTLRSEIKSPWLQLKRSCGTATVQPRKGLAFGLTGALGKSPFLQPVAGHDGQVAARQTLLQKRTAKVCSFQRKAPPKRGSLPFSNVPIPDFLASLKRATKDRNGP